MLTLCVAGLITISWPPLAFIFSRALETHYDDRRLGDDAEAIVVLSGACETADLSHPISPLAADSYSRSFYGAWLYQSQPPRPVLVTGRNCATAMAHFLESEGVPRGAILEESRATNTHENAVNSSKILEAKDIHKVILVTDAKSMLRAELCFRNQGLDVLPFPIGRDVWQSKPQDFIPNWQALESNAETVHETAGLFWYRVRGWI